MGRPQSMFFPLDVILSSKVEQNNRSNCVYLCISIFSFSCSCFPQIPRPTLQYSCRFTYCMR